MKRTGKNTKEDVLVEVVRLSGCGKRSRGGVRAEGRPEADSRKRNRKARGKAHEDRREAQAKCRSGSREALKKSGSREGEGETTRAYAKGLQGNLRHPAPERSAITGGNGEGDHLYPSRTQKLSPSAPMVLGG